MKLYKYIYILITILVVCSCSKDELSSPLEKGDSSNAIEFIARHIGYNTSDVSTKSQPISNSIETSILTAYFMVFDKNGSRIIFTDLSGETDPTLIQLVSKSKENLNGGTACFIANVSRSFAENNSKSQNSGVTDLEYFKSAELSFAYTTENTTGDIFSPLVDINGTLTRCIPMLGFQSISISSTSSGPLQIEVPLYRLFSKVEVKINLGTSSGTSFQINRYTINNVPKRVRLTTKLNDASAEISSEDSWVNGSSNDDFYIYENSSVGVTLNNPTIGSGNKTHTFYFYAPEYILIPENHNNYTTEQTKPLMCGTSQHPIHITFNGLFDPGVINGITQNKKTLTYNVYFGENQTTNFSLRRNTHYVNTLTISGTSNNSINNLDYRVDYLPISLADIYNESANCYLVSKPGRYAIPAIKGAYKSLSTASSVAYCTNGTYAERIYTTVGSSSISNVTYLPESKLIVFDVSEINWDNATARNNESAIIALKYVTGEGENAQTLTEWSWHIWLSNIYFTTDDNSKVSFISHDTYTTNSKEHTMMAYNLGSVSNADAGFYYKYGDHRPYISGNYLGGGTNGNKTWNPSEDVNITDTAKSVNDPCPPGYCLPESEVWESGKTTSMSFDNSYFSYRPIISGTSVNIDAIRYPYSYYVKEDGKIDDEPQEELTNQSYNNAVEHTFVAGTTLAPGVARRYTDIKYNVTINVKEGGLWGSNCIISYKESTTNSQYTQYYSTINVTNAKFYEGEWKWPGLFQNYKLTGYKTSGRMISDLAAYELDEKTYWESITWPVVPKGKIVTLIEEALNTMSYKSYTNTILSESANINTSEGYPVRCVRR